MFQYLRNPFKRVARKIKGYKSTTNPSTIRAFGTLEQMTMGLKVCGVIGSKGIYNTLQAFEIASIHIYGLVGEIRKLGGCQTYNNMNTLAGKQLEQRKQELLDQQ